MKSTLRFFNDPSKYINIRAFHYIAYIEKNTMPRHGLFHVKHRQELFHVKQWM